MRYQNDPNEWLNDCFGGLFPFPLVVKQRRRKTNDVGDGKDPDLHLLQLALLFLIGLVVGIMVGVVVTLNAGAPFTRHS